MDDDRRNGMGIVVEYSGKTGSPRWIKPPKTPWDYTQFGPVRAVGPPDETIPLVFGKINGRNRRLPIAGRSTAPPSMKRPTRVCCIKAALPPGVR
jgi:hypothetical protein